MNIYRKLLIALVIIIFSYIIWRLISRRNQILNNLFINREPFNPFSNVDSATSELNSLKDETISINTKSISTMYQNLPLIEFCIKGSYNSALTGKYINTDMIIYLLSRGCRFFDFEVYYIEDPTSKLYTPQVAYSTDGKFITLDSYNSILLDNILSVLAANAFSSFKSPNSNDPLFINLRIKSNNTDVYRAVASSLHYAISDKLYPGQVKENTPIKKLMGYVVLSIDKTIDYNYKNFTSCAKIKNTDLSGCYDLTKFTNIESGSSNMSLNRYKNILNQQNISLQIENDNLKTNISKISNNVRLVLPDVLPENTANPKIKDFIIGYGCQIVPYKFYQLDSGLHDYEVFFNDNNSGIVPISIAIMYYQKLAQQ
jgi:hypothetical protein